MKANELMIGDWVMVRPFSDSEPVKSKITAINYNSYRGKDYTDWVDTEFWDELNLNDIEPIPLIPEILEKNGFVWDNLPMEQYWEQYGLIIYPGGGGYRMNCGQNVSFKIDSVHELQHLLRLCGIDKEIVL